jgi:23S rRNA (guanosine2251-2'-O)-methyltransferase
MNEADIIWGRHPVAEALSVAGRVQRVLVARGAREAGLAEILAQAERSHVPVEQVPRERLDQLARGANHQGVIAAVAPWIYADLNELLALAITRHEPPFLLVLDSVQDVHNLGALIRTAEAVGVHGLILPEHRAAGVTPAVVKSSAGAIEHLLVTQVTNLVRTLDLLKERGIWVIGLAGEAAEPIDRVDLNRPLALVVGSEGKGLSRLVREHCDLLLALPMRGQINSLNAAIAGSIALYAAWRAREKAQ